MKTGHSTVAITDDGTANGVLLGYCRSAILSDRMSNDLKISEFMTPFESSLL